jgi:hypothetical protein
MEKIETPGIEKKFPSEDELRIIAEKLINDKYGPQAVDIPKEKLEKEINDLMDMHRGALSLSFLCKMAGLDEKTMKPFPKKAGKAPDQPIKKSNHFDTFIDKAIPPGDRDNDEE